MKKLLISILFGFCGAFLFAQGQYISASLHPALGKRAALNDATASIAAGHPLSFELNLGQLLGKGKAFETGIGVRQQVFKLRCLKDLEGNPSTSTLSGYRASAMVVAPARFRLHLNQRSEGKHQLWLNLSYIYGRRLLADAWMMVDQQLGVEKRHEAIAAARNFHFAELGLEMEAPLGQKHRIGLSLNYTRTLTPAGRSSYLNSSFQLPGIRIRFSRRVW